MNHSLEGPGSTDIRPGDGPIWVASWFPNAPDQAEPGAPGMPWVPCILPHGARESWLAKYAIVLA